MLHSCPRWTLWVGVVMTRKQIFCSKRFESDSIGSEWDWRELVPLTVLDKYFNWTRPFSISFFFWLFIVPLISRFIPRLSPEIASSSCGKWERNNRKSLSHHRVLSGYLVSPTCTRWFVISNPAALSLSFFFLWITAKASSNLERQQNSLLFIACSIVVGAAKPPELLGFPALCPWISLSPTANLP